MDVSCLKSNTKVATLIAQYKSSMAQPYHPKKGADSHVDCEPVYNSPPLFVNSALPLGQV